MNTQVDMPAEAARLRASVQPIDTPVTLVYGPHPTWKTHAFSHIATHVNAMRNGTGSKLDAVTDSEFTATDAVSVEDGKLRDDGTLDTASVNGKSFGCDDEPLIRLDVTLTRQGTVTADNSRPTCRQVDALFTAFGGGIRSPLIQVQATNWGFPAGGVISGTVIHKLPGKTVNFDEHDLGARILGRAIWHDQPVIVAESIGCGTASPPPVNDKLTISPIRICPNGIILFSTANAWPVAIYLWMSGTTEGRAGDAPLSIDVTSNMRQETR